MQHRPTDMELRRICMNMKRGMLGLVSNTVLSSINVHYVVIVIWIDALQSNDSQLNVIKTWQNYLHVFCVFLPMWGILSDMLPTVPSVIYFCSKCLFKIIGNWEKQSRCLLLLLHTSKLHNLQNSNASATLFSTLSSKYNLAIGYKHTRTVPFLKSQVRTNLNKKNSFKRNT